MKKHIQKIVLNALTKLKNNAQLPETIEADIKVERTRDPAHGDFACNIAMALAKQAKTNPRQLAELIKNNIVASEYIEKIEIAGPGFINFKLTNTALLSIIPEVLDQLENFGRSNFGEGQKVHIEFVSANPTGPLHVGHGRGAAYGATVTNLLKAVGFDVHCDYYVNDAGRQMQILALSTWLRYLELCDEIIAFPQNAYRGHYIIEIAKDIQKQHSNQFHFDASHFKEQIPNSLDPVKDKEAYLDACIDSAKALLGKESFEYFRTTSLETILEDIKDDLAEFGVTYDQWFKESELFQLGMLTEGINLLKEHDYTFEKEGALWFRATSLGDEKDRVLIRSNGQPTYFASDVAYHLYKYNKGYDRIIDVFGADHHGYISRIRAFLKGLGKNPDKLTILLVQFAILYRGKEKVSMSTRAGEFVTLRELRYEVGNDAARFFYIMRKPEQHLDFDLELAKSQSNENPVYYIQYAHARICSVKRQLESFEWAWDKTQGLSCLNLLTTDQEKSLLTCLSRYPELIEVSANTHEPHTLAHYLQELANLFHTYYNAVKFLVPDSNIRNARLCLIFAISQVIVNGLHILGLSAPEVM